MTESNWVYWCPKHEHLVGLAASVGGGFDHLRIPGSCDCPDESLVIRHHRNPPPPRAADVAKRIWDRFLELVAINAWGEAEVIANHPKVKNFLGSVEKYQALYEKAVKGILEEKTPGLVAWFGPPGIEGPEGCHCPPRKSQDGL